LPLLIKYKYKTAGTLLKFCTIISWDTSPYLITLAFTGPMDEIDAIWDVPSAQPIF
jgi:hypothetical protein